LKTSFKLLIEEARKRHHVLNNLQSYLDIIKKTVKNLDPDADIYLFGSVATNTHIYSSDIDVLILTHMEPAKIHFHLWKKGIKEPFQVHVQPPEKIDQYRRRACLVSIN
jgi:hypothetical protein